MDRNVQAMMRTLRAGCHYVRWLPAQAGRLPRLSILLRLRQPLLYSGALLAALGLGAVSVFLGSTLAIRIILGVPLILMFLRFPYALLLAWVLVQVFIASTLTFFSGQNLDTALTVPTLLLAAMPLRATARRIPALTFMLLFLLWVLAGIGIAPLDTWAFLKDWTLYLDFVAVAVLVVHVLTTRRRLMGLIDAILAVSAFIAVYGIYGYVTKHNGQLDPTTGLYRAGSIFDEATSLSFYLSLVIPLALYRLYTLRGLRRAGIVILTGVFLLALGLTFTRAALATVPLCIIILALFWPSRRMKVVLLGSTCALGLLVAYLGAAGYVDILGRFLSPDVATLNGRIFLWRAVLNHFDPTQVFGRGLFASNALLNALHIGGSGVTSIGLVGTSPHSLILGTLYDHGVMGLALLTLTFVALVVGLGRGAWETSGEHRALFATALAVCVGTMAQSLDSNQILLPALGAYFWIIIALPYARYQSRANPAREDGQEARSARADVPSTVLPQTSATPVAGAEKENA